MLTLYDAPRCPYCARVRIVLAEKGVPYDAVVIDLENRPAWLYEKNPVGKVPVLDDDGWVLPESAVIDEYLEERYPEPALLPADAGARAAARLLVFRHDDFSRPYYALRRGEAGAGAALARELAALDALLAAVPYLTGGAFGLADVAYVPWVLRARTLMGLPRPVLARRRVAGRALPAPLDRRRGGYRHRPLVTDVTREELERRLGEDGLVLLDVRTAAEYGGVGGYPCDARQGHVPGALNVDVQQLLGLDPEGIRALVGAPEGAEVVAYCHSGGRSGVAVQLLSAAGYEARNYVGSWHEWSADDGLPIE